MQPRPGWHRPMQCAQRLHQHSYRSAPCHAKLCISRSLRQRQCPSRSLLRQAHAQKAEGENARYQQPHRVHRVELSAAQLSAFLQPEGGRKVANLQNRENTQLARPRFLKRRNSDVQSTLPRTEHSNKTERNVTVVPRTLLNTGRGTKETQECQ